MSNKSMTVSEINSYKDSTLSILKNQIDILDRFKPILKSQDDLSNEEKGNILTVEVADDLQNNLQNEIDKLENFDVVLAVVGTMKAGKSTTINAIVGREILPNRNRPMTALPTLICHNPEKQIPSIKIDPTVLNIFLAKLRKELDLVPKSEAMHQDMQNLIDFIATGGLFRDYYEGEENIFSFLYQLNDLVRLAKEISNIQEYKKKKDILHFPFDKYKDFKNLPMIEVAFNLDSDFKTQGRFMLLDTAGPNEAGQDELKEALADQLERSSAVMIVLDYTQLNSDAEKDVKDEIDKIPSIAKSRLFALVNKFDQKNANSDEADATRKHIFNNLLKDKIELDNIYAVSAQDSYLANRLLAYINQHNDKPVYQADNWVADFAKKMYGRRPEQEYNKSELEDIQQDIQDLIEDSRMAEPMQNVIVNMQMNAPFIAMQSAMAGSGDVFNRLHNTLNIKGMLKDNENLTNAQIQEIRAKIAELQEDAKSLEERKNELKQKMAQVQENIYKHLNLQDKIKIIGYETEQQISKIFDVESNTAKKQLELLGSQKKHINLFQIFAPRKGGRVENEKEKLDRLRDRAKSNGNRLIFDKQDDLEAFQRQAEATVNEFVRNHILTAFDSMLQEGLKAAQSVTDEINQDAEKLSELLKAKFKKDGLDLRIEFKASANLDKHRNKIGQVNLNVTTNTYSETRKESGALGWGKRAFGGLFGKSWGTYTVEYSTYTISKNEVVKALMTAVTDDVVEPLKKQINDKVLALLDVGLKQIDDFGKKVDEITYEIKNALDEQQQKSNQDVSEKEKERKVINELQQAHESLKEDWDKIASIFGDK